MQSYAPSYTTPGGVGQYAPSAQPWAPPPPGTTRRPGRRAVLVTLLGAVVVIGLAVLAVLVLSARDIEPLPKDVDAATTAHAQALTVGNCLQSAPGGDAVAEVTVVPCTEEHRAQVVARTKLSGATFPGDSTVIDRTTAVCPGRSITSDSAPETLGFLVWTPSEDSWEEGDRQGLCIATSPEEPLTGSLVR